jgi:uncharacterized protein
MVEMELIGVRVEVPSNQPMVVLRERDGQKRTLSIWIGGPEATAIAVALEGLEPRRPLTHDLLKIVLDEFGASLVQVVITELRDKVFYADLHLSVAGTAKVISARPSDAIALAVRTATPIHAAEEVLDEAGFVEPDVEEPEDVVEQFREFIDSVDPGDFAS